MPRDTNANYTFYSSPMGRTGTNQGITCIPPDVMGVHNAVGPDIAPPGSIYPIFKGGADSGLSWRWLYNTAYLGAFGYASTAGYDTWTFANTIHGFRLAKTGPITPGVIVPAGTMMGYFSFGSAIAVRLYVDNDVIVQAVQCTAYAPPVNLGTHAATEFSGVGSVLPAKDVTIRLTACPGGMNKIKYRLDPTTALLDSGNSVVALSGSPAANNVGLQVLNQDGTTPLPLQSDIDFPDYNPSVVGGNYEIKFKARYRQIGTPLGGGPANTELTFSISYL